MTVPATMRAVLLTRHGDLDALVVDPAWPTPSAAPLEVLVRVGACGINNTDINTRVGWYAQGDDNGAWGEPLRFPVIQGADVCGRIVAVGAGVPAGRVGERVLVDPWVRSADAPNDLDQAGYVGSELPGGYAEYLAVPATNACVVRSELSDAELAAFPTAAGTALDMLRRADVQPGERVLVTGASGGVGGYAVQLAAALGAEAIGVCAPEKSAAVLALGARATIGRDEDPRAALRALRREHVDVVVDVVGGDGWAALIETLRRGGRYVVSGAIAGPLVGLDLRTLYLNDLVLIGATITPPAVFAELVALIERGAIRPTLAATYSLEQVAEAQQAFVAKRFVGKLVLAVGDSGEPH